MSQGVIRRVVGWLTSLFLGPETKPEPEQPKKRYIKGWQKLRRDTWTAYHGTREVGRCYCCRVVIHYAKKTDGKGWHCSHVIAHSKGGPDKVSNLRCCCPTCNLKMGTQNLETYKRNLHRRK